MKKELEEKIRKVVLEKIGSGGRGNWDVPHTLSAVKWMKKLIKENGGNDKVLVSAMYFHDSCYPDYKAGYSYEESQKMKKNHAASGAEFAQKILVELGDFSQEEVEEIYRLVLNHDEHLLEEKDFNRQLVFEADGLAQMDWQDCPPNFDKENCLKWFKKYFEVERPLRLWKTEFGMKNIQIMKEKNKNYWQDK